MSVKNEEDAGKKLAASAFDDILSSIGEFGRYQRRIYLLLCLPATVCALHKLAWVFLGAQANHRCLMPYETPENASFMLPAALVNMSLPWDEEKGAWSQCERLHANFSDHYFTSEVPSVYTEPCEEYVFDTSKYTSSAIFEFSLVCDNAWMRAVADMLLMLGNLIGSFVFGELSDRYGRRPVFFLALVLQVAAGLIAWMAPSYWSFVLPRIVVGATVPGVYIVGYVIGIEMVGPSKRQYAGVLLNLFFSVGYMLTALLAYLVTDWRSLQLAVSLPGLAFLVYWWFIPESPRWLLSRGRVSDASDILLRAAAENKCAISKSELGRLIEAVAENVQKDKQNNKEKQASMWDAMKFPNLRKNSLIVFLAWFVLTIAYYALSWNTGNLVGNDHVNFVVCGAVEFPAYAFVMYGLDRWGRRFMLSGTMIAGAVALIATVLVPHDMGWLLTTLAMLGKMALTSAFGVIYLYSSEIFPTCVRNAGMGTSSTIAGFGGMFAPFVILLSQVWRQLPFLLLGVLSLLTGMVTLSLPETINRDLPETLEDGQNFGRNKKDTMK